MGVMTRQQCVTLRESLRAAGKRVGFTSGTFDLLHRGHVDYLNAARERVDELFVGVNSDLSVRSYKQPDRPIVSGLDRVALVASLRSVSGAFLFDESNNRANIEALTPDVYIKAGDYTEESLSSAPLVREYGGEIAIVPLSGGYSTTRVIEEIQGRILTTWQPLPRRDRRPAAFLDRDGTILELVDYLHDPAQVRLLPGVIEGLQQLQQRNYYLVIITNQAGIGLGYYTLGDFYRVNLAMMRLLSAHNIWLDKIYFSPHSLSEHTSCRKPDIGLIVRAQADLPLVMERSIFIGDSSVDIECGHRARLTTVLVKTGKKGEDGTPSIPPTYTVNSLAELAEILP